MRSWNKLAKDDLAFFKPKHCECILYFTSGHVLEKESLVEIAKCDFHKESSFDDILNYNKSQELLEPKIESEVDLRLDALEALTIGEQSALSKIREKLGL